MTRNAARKARAVRKCEAQLDQAQARPRAVRMTRGGGKGSEGAAAADGEACDVCRQCRGEGLHQQPPARQRCEKRAAAEGAQVVAVCAAIEAEIAAAGRGRARRVPRRTGTGRAGTQPRDPRRVSAARAADLLHGGTEGRSAPGRCVRARRLRRQLARSTQTSSVASSVPRSSPLPTTWRASGEAGAKEAGKLRLEGKEYVVHEGDVMHFRFNV